MINKIKIINKDWKDNVIVNFEESNLYRENKKNDMANFCIQNNILIVKWLNWNEEYFAEYKNTFYNLTKINFKTEDWEDICYIDYFNNIVYRPNENQKGIMKLINHFLYLS